ncbi:hypothetical protein [uncultured Tenacibaculum sp.]|uniref:hypothetical protein n=1 Tax=uncultured Tenacibaculum sp. TaxID=174713 RepID=UPI0026028549|nr:hypothetical protein [uncultured Tenacibaculum sp.]
MKNLVIVLALFLGLNTFSQQFEKTDDFYITEIDSTTRREYWDKFPHENQNLPIFLKDKDNNTILELSVNLMSYDETSVHVLNTNNFNNIKQVVRITTSHTACCSTLISHYLCITTDGNVIKLPQLENSHCDGPEPWVEYIFPNQKNGQKNRIIMAESIYNPENNSTTSTLQKTLTWNGNNFQTETIKNSLATR